MPLKANIALEIPWFTGSSIYRQQLSSRDGYVFAHVKRDRAFSLKDGARLGAILVGLD